MPGSEEGGRGRGGGGQFERGAGQHSGDGVDSDGGAGGGGDGSSAPCREGPGRLRSAARAPGSGPAPRAGDGGLGEPTALASLPAGPPVPLSALPPHPTPPCCLLPRLVRRGGGRVRRAGAAAVLRLEGGLEVAQQALGHPHDQVLPRRQAINFQRCVCCVDHTNVYAASKAPISSYIKIPLTPPSLGPLCGFAASPRPCYAAAMEMAVLAPDCQHQQRKLWYGT